MISLGLRIFMRKKRGLFAGFFLATLAVFPPFASADFDDLGMGARAQGMGNAFTGLADDSRAIYYNPAGLAWQTRSQVSADYSRLLMGLDDSSSLSLGFLSYVHPLYKAQRPSRGQRRVFPNPPAPTKGRWWWKGRP
jgi:hypothetical protein